VPVGVGGALLLGMPVEVAFGWLLPGAALASLVALAGTTRLDPALVAAGLGSTSRYTWLKLPHCPGYERVARATTLPILLLGGESVGNPRPLLEQIAAGLAAGATVRGALAGRNVLYPGDIDPLAVARAVNGLIHRGWTVDQAVAALDDAGGAQMDALSRWFPT